LLYVSKIVEAAQVLGEKPFDQLIGAANQQDTQPCSKCNKEALIMRRMATVPSVYALSLVWPSSRPSRRLMNDFFNTISMEIDLKNVSELDLGDKEKQNKLKTTFHLRGMILYYGRHYTACFYHDSIQRWLRFDDTRVDPVGRYWHEVHDWCVQSRFQPSVLFYEREEEGQVYYQATTQDVIPRPLKTRIPSLIPSPEPVEILCPNLQGPIFKKNKKKQWIRMWAKLSDWALAFYSQPQMSYVVTQQRWAQCRRDPPILILPIATLQEVKQDTASHNFNKSPTYLLVTALSDGETAAESYNIFIEHEAPFVQWLSALNQAMDLLKRNQTLTRTKSFIIDNEVHLSSDSQTSSSIREDSKTALQFAPDASVEDLRRIAEMESGSPRTNGEDSDEATTVLHGTTATSIVSHSGGG
jgi:hypothetical protein